MRNLPVPRTENVGSILERDLDATIAFRMGVVKKDGAYEHRMLRREPGYTVPMLMEESQILQGIIFKIRISNLPFSRCQKAPLDVIPIADELDSQLKPATFAIANLRGLRWIRL
jgi:hypothetical protein